MIEAEVILHSVGEQAPPLMTMRARYPKFIHAELMTHRVFSRNASSSRAIPTARYLAEVRDPLSRAAPVMWGAEQKGMNPGGALDTDATNKVQYLWGEAARFAVSVADAMAAQGAHKSIVNRVLDPFVHINVLITSTEWDNFFGLRLDTGADPTMRELAEIMWVAYRESEPTRLGGGDWHLPYVDVTTLEDLDAWLFGNQSSPNLSVVEAAKRVSVARCARVSYNSFETGTRTRPQEDLNLYDRLVGAQPMHASPAEHQATPDAGRRNPYLPSNDLDHLTHPGYGWNSIDVWSNPSLHGNLRGWIQFRKTLAGEAVAPMPAGYVR